MECTIDAMWMDIGLVAAVLVFLGLPLFLVARLR